MPQAGIHHAPEDAPTPPMKASVSVPGSGAGLIAAERRRQIDEEGWSAEHDDSHTNGEMGQAALVYFDCARMRDGYHLRVLEDNPDVQRPKWPWSFAWFKPEKKGDIVVDRLRCFVKAGALALAEIERLQRVVAQCEENINVLTRGS